MSWNSNSRSNSQRMYQMSSRMQEDNVRAPLLSPNEDEDDLEETTLHNVVIPELNFRNEAKPVPKAEDEKKSRCAVLSILVVGLALILIINIGVGMKMKEQEDLTLAKNPASCPVKTVSDVIMCDRTFPWHNYRLPDGIQPDHYSIFLWPNLTRGIFNGSVSISVSVKRSTSRVILHSKQLNLSHIYVGKSGAAEIGQYSVVFCKQLDFMAINLKERLQPGQKYDIKINFTGDMQSSLRGFYLSKYHTISGKSMKLGTTQFEPLAARRAFPCFDEPRFKAKFSLSIVREDSYKTLSNMPVQKTTPLSTGLKLDDFQTTLSMSTYLVAFIISEFDVTSRTIEIQKGPLNVSVYAQRDEIKTAEFALDVACKVIPFYEKLFRIPYPLPKLDLVAIPDFEAGAMENWGLVTYRETAVLWDEETSSIYDKEYVALVIAHEFAHQWFGNLVTMDWWNDLWLNEGFASFMEYYAVDQLYREWHYMDGFFGYHTSAAMSTDESEYTHPISVPVDSAVKINEIFDSISYSKGACLIMMMIDYLGEKAFLGGVNEYLKEFSYKNSQNKNLVNAVAAKAETNSQKDNVLNMLDSWTSQPGFPVVNVSLDGNVVTISQTRYLARQHETADTKCGEPQRDLIWQIPISYSTSLSSSKNWYYFENKTDKFTVDGTPEWIILNVDRGGYYLVNYDEKLMSSIVQQFQSNHSVFSPNNRAGILFSAIKMAKTGRMSYTTLFDLISYAKNENELGPITLVSDILFSVISKMKLQFNNDALSKMKTYTKSLLGSLYQRYGWPKINETNLGLTHPQIKLRRFAISLMCAVDDKNCTDEGLKRFRLWKDENITLPSDYKSIIYGLGIKYGTSEDWDFMWNKYISNETIDASEKGKILSALCQTGNQDKVLHLLDESMKNTNIRSQDVSSLFSSLGSTQMGNLLTWKFLRIKWADLTKIFPVGSTASSRFLNVFSEFTDDVDISAAEEFIAENNLANVQSVKRAVDHAKFNVHWIKTIQPQIIRWLNEKFSHP